MVGDEIEALVLGSLAEVAVLVEGELLVELLETLGLIILPLLPPVEQLARKNKDKIKIKFFFFHNNHLLFKIIIKCFIYLLLLGKNKKYVKLN